MKTINEIADNYFTTLNPIAERLSTDILAIQDAYEGLWSCLSLKEQNQIINETVVHPEAILKYTLKGKAYEGADFGIPLINREETGGKFIVDENTGISWRDEHSAPFSWKTPSQIDLSIFTASPDDLEGKIEKAFFPNHTNKKTENLNGLKTSNPTHNENNKEAYFAKKQEKNESKKNNSPPQTHNVVLVGTSSKFSEFCSKLKFLPGKSYSYEVQTVVQNNNAANEGSFLDRIKATAVMKIQNTLKLVGGKNEEKEANKETENLVQSKGAPIVVKLQKPSPKIAKPKSPPPPPPSTKNDEKENKNGKNLILIRNSRCEKSQNDEKDSERAVLLGENSVQSFLSADPDSLDQDSCNKVAHDLSDDFNSISTECTPLSGPSVDIIPKSGFDFLDNW